MKLIKTDAAMMKEIKFHAEYLLVILPHHILISPDTAACGEPS
jgi:hypothetical protein